MGKSVQLIGTVVVLCGMLAAGGCANGEITAETVRDNWAPELGSLTRAEEMDKTARARTVATNLRMIVDDVDRLLLLESPSGMAPWNVPR